MIWIPCLFITVSGACDSSILWAFYARWRTRADCICTLSETKIVQHRKFSRRFIICFTLTSGYYLCNKINGNFFTSRISPFGVKELIKSESKIAHLEMNMFSIVWKHYFSYLKLQTNVIVTCSIYSIWQINNIVCLFICVFVCLSVTSPHNF